MRKFYRTLIDLRGVKIIPFEFTCSAWDGFGFSVLEVSIYQKGPVCLLQGTYEFFMLNLNKDCENDGVEWKIQASICFKSFTLWSKVTVPKKDSCVQCNDLCETKEFYKNEKAYCSENCQDWDSYDEADS